VQISNGFLRGNANKNRNIITIIIVRRDRADSGEAYAVRIINMYSFCALQVKRSRLKLMLGQCFRGITIVALAIK
jgi:hypothetical protein